MEAQLIQGLAYFLKTKDIKPFLGQLSLLTKSEIIQIRVMNEGFGWIPLGRLLQTQGAAGAESYYEEFSKTVAEEVARSKQFIDVHNTAISPLSSESLSELDVKSFACFPILGSGKVIAVVFAASMKFRPALTPSIVALLQSVTQAIASILEHEYQYEHTLQKYSAQQAAIDHGIVTAGEGMQAVLDLLPRIAQTKAPVLISGETGTGKELIARAIHKSSYRSKHPFVTVHCGALSESLIESELFGHVKGAFTGASQNKTGYFGLAEKGSIFLDEITTASREVQIKLLRVLENSEIVPVGTASPRHIDVRIIVAANENLEDLVQRNMFRKDLYYRLKVLEIKLPPLRERSADIRALAHHFLNQFTRHYGKNILGFTEELLDNLQQIPWEGNVRQLKHLVERLVVLAEPNTILSAEDLRHLDAGGPVPGEPAEVAERFNAIASYQQFKDDVLHSLERKFLLRKMEESQWIESRAAKQLGMARSTLLHRLKVLKIERPVAAKAGVHSANGFAAKS